MLASVPLNQVSEILIDATKVTWTEAQLIAWLNDAQLAVALVRPDSSSEITTLKLAAGTTKQQLASGALRLLSIVRNMGSDGATPGDAIDLVERGVKDALDRGWHSADKSAVVDEYVFDERRPTDFYVSPPTHVTTNVWIELSQAIAPKDIVLATDSIALLDVYSAPLQEWMLYKAFSRDSEETPNHARAESHKATFGALLTGKFQVDAIVSPKVRAHLQ